MSICQTVCGAVPDVTSRTREYPPSTVLGIELHIFVGEDNDTAAPKGIPSWEVLP